VSDEETMLDSPLRIAWLFSMRLSSCLRRKPAQVLHLDFLGFSIFRDQGNQQHGECRLFERRCKQAHAVPGVLSVQVRHHFGLFRTFP
jgi:hypothetical protein